MNAGDVPRPERPGLEPSHDVRTGGRLEQETEQPMDSTPGLLTVRPMRADAFPAWPEQHIASYATSVQQRFGLDRTAAVARATDELDTTLPHGVLTDHMHLVVLEDREEGAVGTAWWGRHPRRIDSAYVSDMHIREGSRGHGVGRAAMRLIAADARARGYRAIGLSVSESNLAARHLYESLGYRTVSSEMMAELPTMPPTRPQAGPAGSS